LSKSKANWLAADVPGIALAFRVCMNHEHALSAANSTRHLPHLVDTTMFWSRTGGGVARYLRDKRRWATTRAGWRSSWVVPGACDATDRSVRGVPLPASGGYRFPLQRRRATDAIADLEPDLIETGDPFTLAWAALDAAQRRGVPVAAFCHSNVAEQASRGGPWVHRAARRYLRHVYGHFDVVFAASRWMADEARDLGLDNVVHQPLGVDLTRFHPSKRSEQWRRDLGIPQHMIVLIYVGRFAPEKNLHTLAEAVDLLGRDHVLVVQGAGPCPPQGERVLRLPFSDDADAIARALASADVFVHGGTRETFGLAPLESLACGTPVVLPARAGFLDLIDMRAAIGAGAGTAAQLAEAIRSLLAAEPASVRAQARLAAEAFSLDRSLAQLFDRYSALLSMNPRTDEPSGRLHLA
jgi:alpha-1,6-mannosyltransferase